MLSFSDVRRYTQDSPALSRIKPWWEVIIDFLLIGLFIGVILIYTQANAGKIACVPLHGDASNFGSAEAAYVVSRCAIESDATYILLYPYLLFIEWGIMLLSHIYWIKFPGISTKIDSYYDLITALKEVEPTYTHDINSLKFLPEISFDDKQFDKLHVIYEKMLIVTVDKSSIQSKYEAKTRIFAVTVIISILGSVLWVIRLAFLSTDFECNLISGPTKKEYTGYSCDMSTLLYIYGIIIYHFLILLALLLFSIKAVVWSLKKNLFTSTESSFFSAGQEEFRGLPGSYDFLFILSNLEKNTSDGGHTMEIIRAAFRINSQKRPDNKFELDSPSKFTENRLVIEYICDILGLEVQPNTQCNTHVFECLEQIRQNIEWMKFELNYDIKKEIIAEISNNALHFRFVVEEYFDYLHISPPDFSSETTAEHERIDRFPFYIQALHDPTYIGNHLLLMAASNLMKIRIIVLIIQTPDHNKLTSIEIFEPFSSGKSLRNVFVTFIPPHYFHFAKPICFSHEICKLREEYAFNSEIRYQVKNRALNHFSLISINQDDNVEEENVEDIDYLFNCATNINNLWETRNWNRATFSIDNQKPQNSNSTQTDFNQGDTFKFSLFDVDSAYGEIHR